MVLDSSGGFYTLNANIIRKYLPSGTGDTSFSRTIYPYNGTYQFNYGGTCAYIVNQKDNTLRCVGSMLKSPDTELIVLALSKFGVPLSSYGVAGTKHENYDVNQKGGITTPAKAFGDSLNRLTIVGQTILYGINNFFSTRWFANGAVDSSYGQYGVIYIPLNTSNQNAFNLQLLQSDGKLLLAGTINTSTLKDVIVSRYLSNGKIDTSFGVKGQTVIAISYLDDVPSDIAVGSDGKIILSATTALGAVGNDFVTIRLLPNGTLDSTFNNTGFVKLNLLGNDDAKKIWVQADNKIIIAGETTGSNKDIAFARYLTNGILDASFATGGKVVFGVGAGDDLLLDLKLIANSKITALVQTTSTSATVMQLDNAGLLNTGFGTSGMQTLNYLAKQIVPDSVGGFYTQYPNYIRKYFANGSLDLGFGQSGGVDWSQNVSSSYAL